MSVGLTLGKFLPLHKGHELLLRVAAENVDTLVVLIGCHPSDPFSYELRSDWVKEAVADSGVLLKIFPQFEHDKTAEKDAAGTVTDENYWQIWLEDTRRILAEWEISTISHIFTSDLYGERIAAEFGAKWIPVDPDREMISISGTKIRDDFYTNFKFLPAYTKRSMVKIAAILGPESCGKSTLVQHLSGIYDTIPEYGRILSVNRKNYLDRDDFQIIQRTQDMLIRKLVDNASQPIIVTDTEALVTALYADIWFPDEDNSEFFEYATRQKIDKYIVLAPTVPWIQDGLRTMDTKEKRWDFFNKITVTLETWGKDYAIIDSPDFHIRHAQVDEILKNMIPSPKY